jgi:hypothetical protein
MSETTGKTFACPRCGNRFAWKPSLAGKKLSCTCGRMIDVELGSAPYETATASSGSTKRITAVSTDSEEEEATFSLLKDRILPISLIIVGLAGRVAQAFFLSSRTHHPVASTAMVAFDLISSIAVALLGGYFAAAMLAVNFGHLGTAAMKLTAIAVFTMAAAAWVPYMDNDPLRIRGMVLALQSAVLIYFALFYAMFELDMQEAMLATLIVGAIQGLVMVGMHAAA